MKPPHKVRVGLLTYKVEYKKGLVDEDNDFLYGYFGPSEQIIQVNTDTTEEKQPVILMHECLHAIGEQLGDADLSEAHTQIWSYALVEFIRRNPEFIAYIGQEPVSCACEECNTDE